MTEKRNERRVFLVVLGVVVFVPTSRQTVNVKGAGASFPLNVYNSWIPAYEMYRRDFKDVHMTYDSIGSGGGKARIKDEVGPPVDYAGSDSPLADEDYRKHPDLQMFPTMAGAVVCVFNLPGISRLNMTMQQLAGIYSGRIRWWNDSSLININPEITLPERQIITTARRDKSGTTEIFTRALSSSDPEWEQKYGTFSLGVDENDRPYHWNPEAVHVFGLTNRGLSGMILSTRYSVGYLVMSEVTSMKLSYAFLRNLEGNFVAPTIPSVQEAMKATTSRFDARMTASLSEPSGNESYPLAGYTYFIIRMSAMSDCETAKELVRYIEWFFTNHVASQHCSDKSMVPLPSVLYDKIIQQILHRVTCRGRSVVDLVRAEIEEENSRSNTWILPLSVGVGISAVVVVAGSVYVLIKKTKTWREVMENKWKIEANEIGFRNVSLPEPKAKTAKDNNMVVKNRIRPTSRDHAVQINSSAAAVTSHFGEWRGNLVHLKAMEMNRFLTYNKKKKILWMTKAMQHKNVTRFYGLALLNDTFHSVMEYHDKGSLAHFLHRSNLKTNVDLNFSICYEMVCGMKFLHKNNLVHGDLRSSNCYFDGNWLLKISDWQFEALDARTRKHVDHDNIKNITKWDEKEFWAAPELLQRNGKATKRSDVYSFGITMQEVFSRDVPYSEYSTSKSPGEVLEDVISTSLRPVFVSTTPYIARVIMEMAWDSDPWARPSFALIQQKIEKTSTRGNIIVDSIIHLLEEYVGELEETIEKIEKVTSSDKLEKESNEVSAIDTILSAPVAPSVQPKKYRSVTVVVCDIFDFKSLVTRISFKRTADLLTELFHVLDQATRKREMYRLEVTAGDYKAASGLPATCDDHAHVAAEAALEFMSLARTVFVHADRNETMRLRVGVSSGSVYVRNTPSHPGRYFVCGDAVVLASRLAEYGHTTTVLISESTEELLRTKFHTIPNLDTVPWNGTPLKTFWLIGSKNQCKPLTV